MELAMEAVIQLAELTVWLFLGSVGVSVAGLLALEKVDR
jgi:hypothetical protein